MMENDIIKNWLQELNENGYGFICKKHGLKPCNCDETEKVYSEDFVYSDLDIRNEQTK